MRGKLRIGGVARLGRGPAPLAKLKRFLLAVGRARYAVAVLGRTRAQQRHDLEAALERCAGFERRQRYPRRRSVTRQALATSVAEFRAVIRREAAFRTSDHSRSPSVRRWSGGLPTTVEPSSRFNRLSDCRFKPAAYPGSALAELQLGAAEQDFVAIIQFVELIAPQPAAPGDIGAVEAAQVPDKIVAAQPDDL